MGYIELETAIEILRKSHKSHAENYRDEVLLARDIRLLKEIPTADVVEVRHGKWQVYLDGNLLMCSSCKTTFFDESGNGGTNYCPDCGAKMEGE